MSVQLHPPNTLNFNRPLTQLVKRTLSIHNPNGQAVVFKVKTTAPKLYCVRPNSGTIPAKESVEVSVMLQPMKEEPPLTAKCKDKFLIQSTFVPAEKEGAQATEIWNSIDSSEEGRVQQQKLKVAYLPPEGQSVPEEDEGVNGVSMLHPNDSNFGTVRQHPVNDHLHPMPEFNNETVPVPPPVFSDSRTSSETQREAQREAPVPAPARTPEPRPLTPEPVQAEPAPAPVAPAPPRVPTPPPAPVREVIQERKPEPAPAPPVTVPKPAPEFVAPVISAAPSLSPPVPVPAPAPAPVPAPAQVSRDPTQTHEFKELVAKYKDSQREIERLQTILASSTPVELRRRNRTLVDDGSTIVGSDVGTTVIDDGVQYQPAEGVPLQIVVAIAFAVFVTTYLFF